MITLFDQEEVLEDYIASEDVRKSKERVKRLYESKHMSPTELADIFGYSIDVIERWLGFAPQV